MTPINARISLFLNSLRYSSESVRLMKKCIENYPKPKGCVPSLRWLCYRIWNAVKHIIGVSDFQLACKAFGNETIRRKEELFTLIEHVALIPNRLSDYLDKLMKVGFWYPSLIREFEKFFSKVEEFQVLLPPIITRDKKEVADIFPEFLRPDQQAKFMTALIEYNEGIKPFPEQSFDRLKKIDKVRDSMRDKINSSKNVFLSFERAIQLRKPMPRIWPQPQA